MIKVIDISDSYFEDDMTVEDVTLSDGTHTIKCEGCCWTIDSNDEEEMNAIWADWMQCAMEEMKGFVFL